MGYSQAMGARGFRMICPLCNQPIRYAREQSTYSESIRAKDGTVLYAEGPVTYERQIPFCGCGVEIGTNGLLGVALEMYRREREQ